MAISGQRSGSLVKAGIPATKECDQGDERHAKTHSGCDQLQDIHVMESFESSLTAHIGDSNEPDENWNKNHCHKSATSAHESLLTRTYYQTNWRQISISLINSVFGEEKAHTCAIA